MAHSFIHYEKINGYIKVSYTKDGFVVLFDEETNESIKFHHTMIKLLQKSIKINYSRQQHPSKPL